MQIKLISFLVAFPLLACCGVGSAVSVVPEPQSIEYSRGHFRHRAGSEVMSSEIDPSLGSESYILEIGKSGIKVQAGDSAGLFYAGRTLRQMLPVGTDLEASTWKVPCLKISDSPRYGYRGFMLDVSRYFTPKEELLPLIDAMAELKLNTLHLHLTDDNGWRLEIKKYPLLTEVGSRRVKRDAIFPGRRNAQKGEPTEAGGFYTQDDIREIVAYAAQRHIKVIPEIELPAHSNAALAAYPELACPVVKDFIGVLPGIGADHADIIFCAGNDKCLEFWKGVIDEVAQLFPSEYIHIGGDEAGKSNWKKCPLCQARIRKEALGDEEALQGWFMEEVNKYIRSKGKTAMAWDEVTNSKVPTEAVVFGWRGMGNAALKAAAQGHKMVLTPAKVMYLIRYQGPQWFEPFTYFGNNTLEDIFDFEPFNENTPKSQKDLLMGVQGSMWTEFCNSASDVRYMVFPRLLAVAENAWTLPENKDWSKFIAGVDNFLPVLDELGINYSKSMYNIQHTVVPDGHGNVDVDLEKQRPDLEIVTQMNADTTLITAYTTKDGKKMGETLELKLNHHKAFGRKVEGGGELGYVLTNGLRGSLKASDFEWTLGAAPNFDNSFTVDLGSVQSISKVSLGCINNYDLGLHLPESVTLELSNDGSNYITAASVKFSKKQIFREGTFTEDIVMPLEAEARYLRCSLKGPGPCPEGHVRSGLISKVYTDEIIVE